MGVLVGLVLGTLIAVVWQQGRATRLLSDIKKAVEAPHEAVEAPQAIGTVTDPFTRPKERQTSSTSVIVPKTAAQLRNENFDKIVEEGKKKGYYGHIG